MKHRYTEYDETQCADAAYRLSTFPRLASVFSSAPSPRRVAAAARRCGWARGGRDALPPPRPPPSWGADPRSSPSTAAVAAYLCSRAPQRHPPGAAGGDDGREDGAGARRPWAKRVRTGGEGREVRPRNGEGREVRAENGEGRGLCRAGPSTPPPAWPRRRQQPLVLKDDRKWKRRLHGTDVSNAPTVSSPHAPPG